MNKGTTASTDLTPLNVPVPPMLAKVMGYRGEARFVSFQWTPYGDEADYSDGRGVAPVIGKDSSHLSTTRQ
jgi:hypothetical protein